MKRTLLWSALGAASLAVSWSIGPATATDESRVDVVDMIPALGLPQTADDALPEHLDLEGLGNIRPDTIRKVGSDDRASYWVARSGTSGLCLIVHLPWGHELSGSSCGPATHTYRHGLGLSLMDGGEPMRAVEAYLLPEDVDEGALTRHYPMLTVLQVEGATVAAFHPHEGSGSVDQSPRPWSMDRPNGARFEFTPLPLTAGRGTSAPATRRAGPEKDVT